LTNLLGEAADEFATLSLACALAVPGTAACPIEPTPEVIEEPLVGLDP
jgi:hypothetical protein